MGMELVGELDARCAFRAAQRVIRTNRKGLLSSVHLICCISPMRISRTAGTSNVVGLMPRLALSLVDGAAIPDGSIEDSVFEDAVEKGRADRLAAIARWLRPRMSLGLDDEIRGSSIGCSKFQDRTWSIWIELIAVIRPVTPRLGSQMRRAAQECNWPKGWLSLKELLRWRGWLGPMRRCRRGGCGGERRRPEN
jgi:hypothetical protein